MRLYPLFFCNHSFRPYNGATVRPYSQRITEYATRPIQWSLLAFNVLESRENPIFFNYFQFRCPRCAVCQQRSLDSSALWSHLPGSTDCEEPCPVLNLQRGIGIANYGAAFVASYRNQIRKPAAMTQGALSGHENGKVRVDFSPIPFLYCLYFPRDFSPHPVPGGRVLRSRRPASPLSARRGARDVQPYRYLQRVPTLPSQLPFR